jgi:glucose-1-phosphate cytidylyltransferase
MKVGILVGGRGTRLMSGEEAPPKALYEIGGRPIIWHIMQMFAAAEFNEFVLLLGYKAQEIVDYFVHRLPFEGRDISLQIGDAISRKFLTPGQQALWEVILCHTGLNSEKGERIRRILSYVQGEENFMITYGDGVADIDLRQLAEFHRSHGKIATLTAVRAKSQFGHVDVSEDGQVLELRENPMLPEWINGGFFVFRKEIFNWLEKDDLLENGCFRKLAAAGQLRAYRHEGFWTCMDTYKDNLRLNEMWESNNAPWAVWRNS